MQSHYAALNAASQLGFGTPWYDRNDNKNDKIVIIPIDEVSFGSNVPELHQYPLPRHIYGTMLKHLAAAVAGYCILRMLPKRKPLPAIE